MFRGKNNKSIIEELMNDPQPLPRKVPDYMRTKGGFWYWTGAMVMTAFFYEAITGLILLFYYSPSAAYTSTMSFLNKTPYGSIILTTHLYGAYAMIVLLYLHLLRSMFVGAYKAPRQMQWLIGILLLLLTLGVGFFGYSMNGDVLSQDAVGVGKGIASGFPMIGWWLNLIFFGGGSSLSLFTRLLGWHIALAAGIGVLFAAHFFLAEYNTIMPRVEKNASRAPLIDEESPSYKPWYPYNMIYMGQIMLLVTGIIILIPSLLAVLPNVPALFSPFPQVAPGSPLLGNLPAYPPWFLLFIYKELDFHLAETIGPFWATVLFAGLPLGYLTALPMLDAGPTLKLENRPVTVSFGITGIVYLAVLSTWGALTPGVPIPNWQFLVFFVAVGVVIYLITSYVCKGVRENSFKIPMPGIFFLSLGILGLSSFGSGALILESIETGWAVAEVAMVLMLMVTAISALVAVGIFMGMIPFKDRKPAKRLSGRWYTFFGFLFGFVAFGTLGIMMVIPPTSAYNSSLYGIGLGLIFIISSTLLRLYRSYSYGE